jgi:hypothetical protein
MKKSIFTMALATLVLSAASFAQTASSDHVVTNDDNPSGNTATLFSFNGTALSVDQTLKATNQFGIGGGYFANNRITQVGSGKCLYISNAGSETISGFARTSLNPLTYNATPTNTNVGGGASEFGIGMAATPDNKFVYATLDEDEEVAIFSTNPTTCALTSVGTVSGLGDAVGPISVSSDGKVAIITGPNNEFVSAYAIGSTGGLTLINTVQLSEISSCSSTGCFVTGQDISEVKSGKASVVMGNATLSGPYYVVCALNTTSGLSNCVNNNLTGTSLSNVESPYYNKAGYAGTSGGGIYLGAAGFGSGEPAGVSLNAVNSSGVPTAAAEASYTNSSGYYCSNAQSYSHAPTIQYVYQSCTNSSEVNTMYVYKSNGSSSITPLTSLGNPNADGTTFVLSIYALPQTR